MTGVSVDWDTLRRLAGFQARDGCAVSFYLDLDPHVSPTAADAHTRTRALLDEAHRLAEATRDERSHEQRESIGESLERLQLYLDLQFAREGVQGLAVFAASRDGLWQPLPLWAPVPDAVKIGAELHLTPLVPLVGDGGGALVAVVGRERGDLYEIHDGRLDEIATLFDEQPRRHDQGGWSQANYQRHVDNLADRHLRGVANALGRELRKRRRAEIVVACPDETRADFATMLSAEARAAVVGWAHAEAHAAATELLAVVKPFLERTHAEREAAAVSRWHDEIGRSGRACAGWGPTFEAASDGRVDLLMYEPGVNRAAWRCPSCGRLQAEGGSCPLDGGELERCDDGLDLVLHRTLELGGTARAVTFRRDLDPVGGIGALLRF
jgi:peptide chain release factor subunit 1